MWNNGQNGKLFVVTQFIGLILLCNTFSYSAPHISGKVLPQEPRDYVHKLPDVNKLKAIGYSKSAIAKAIGTTGTKKVAVLLVNFASKGNATGESDMGINPGYSVIQDYLKKLVQFYSENSYGKFNLQISTFPSDSSAYTLTNPMSYYGDNGPGGVYIERNSYYLIRDALNMANSQGMFISTGSYDAVVVLHAGYGEESGTDNSYDIWSLFLDWKNKYSYLNGFSEGVIMPSLGWLNSSPFGVICHEFGHQLGLPDLYSTIADVGAGETQTRVGKWCLMDAGTWAGNPAGSQPSHLSAWCKKYLGWLSPTNTKEDIPSSQIISGKRTGVAFPPSETSSTGVYKIPIEMGSTAEYFLLEYRRKNEPNAIFNKGLPGEGMLIWHIDDTIGNIDKDNDINVSTSHPRVALEPADKIPPFINNNQGDAGDPFSVGNQFTDPDSRAYNGTVTAISVLNFSGTGGAQMLADVFKTQVASYVGVTKLYNYPNPSPSGRTAITFTLNRPTSLISLDIYNLAGEFIRSFSYNDMQLTKVEDFIYGYTINWNGNNTSGENVADGIYIYLLRADKEYKTGKLAIFRR